MLSLFSCCIRVLPVSHLLFVNIIPGLSSDPPRHREYGGGVLETTGKMRQTKITENGLFY